jgi:hypothetical protein
MQKAATVGRPRNEHPAATRHPSWKEGNLVLPAISKKGAGQYCICHFFYFRIILSDIYRASSSLTADSISETSLIGPSGPVSRLLTVAFRCPLEVIILPSITMEESI